MITLDDPTGVNEADRTALEAALARMSFVEDLVRWLFALQPAGEIADIVVQDEFTHDMIVSWKSPRYLVFDTT